MADYVDQGDLKQLIVQLKDGSTWTAEIGLDGKVRLLKQLTDPSSTHDADEQESEQQDQQQPQAQQPEQADAGEGESEEADDQPEEAWGEAKPADEQYSQDEIDKLINEMQRRGGHNLVNKPAPRRKLDSAYHKRLRDPAFLARLQSVMLDNKYARRVRGRTRGKLDMTRLYKVPTWSRSVFMQKQERKGKNYNIVFVIDQSGSMSGRQAEIAAESVLFLAKQFEHLNLNLGVIGYGSGVKVHKELNDKKIDYDHLYSDLTNGMGGTNDYPALRRGYHMFRGAPEGKNILIQMSDGGPGYYYDVPFMDVDNKQEHIKQLPDLGSSINYNEPHHLHHLVNSHPDVVSVGIGIGAGGWQIPEHSVIHDIKDLKPTILGILRKNIKRG